jgi:apolipoprotein D and lipocalin family protein
MMQRSRFGRSRLAVALLAPLLGLAACQTARLPDLPRTQVDLARFMGDWYVIANIPSLLEKGAHNAVESYALAANGTINTTFTFRAGSFAGKPRRYQPRGFVLDRDRNDLWGMRFVWPIKADYRITHVNPDYTQTVVSRQKRDYVWIMARTPQIPTADYERLLGLVAAQGYDISKVQRVPQQWPQP